MGYGYLIELSNGGLDVKHPFQFPVNRSRTAAIIRELAVYDTPFLFNHLSVYLPPRVGRVVQRFGGAQREVPKMH